MAMTGFRKAAVARGACTLPGEAYTSDAVFDAEKERIFFGHWICVGRGEQIPGSGDYRLARVVDQDLILVRDRLGVARAFYNVCRHRGTRLCERPEGRFSETIQCPYHAWTYGLDGRLLGARNMQEVAGFDRGDYPLYAVALAEWEGFLFVNFAPEPEPWGPSVVPLGGKLAAWTLPALRVAHRVVYDVRANWKQVVENYSECYHCPLVHPALERLTPSTSGRNDFDRGPVLGGYMTLTRPDGSLTTTGHTSRPPVGMVAGDDLRRVYFYSIFPNLLLSLHPDYVMAHELRPTGARRTEIVCEWLFDPATMALPGFDPGDAVEFWDLTNRQDWHVCELTQLGVQSRAYTPGPYSHAEGLLAAFDRYYLDVMRGETSAN